ncbi:hypothetical protein SMC26_27550 [Actinomadura fulvescens]
MIYRYGEDRLSEAKVEGWFDPDRAQAFVEANTVTDDDYAQWERTGRGSIRGVRETLFHTDSGQWVLHRHHLGPSDCSPSTWELLPTDHQAVDWLTRNGYTEAVTRLLPDLPAETGPGRPEIGGRVQVRLGDLLPQVDQYADRHGISRAEAVRTLISAGLEHSGS